MSSRDDERITVEGEPSKRFGVYNTALNGDAIDCEGRFDTFDEVVRHCRRMDRRYQIEVGRKFMNLTEFKAKYDPKQVQ